MATGPGRRRGPTLLALTTPIALLSGASMVGTLLTPVLAPAHPLLLVALCPRGVNLALASSRSPLWAFLVVGLMRLAAADPWHFLVGRHCGEQLAAWTDNRAPRVARTLARTQRAVERLGLTVVAVRPNGPVLAAAGSCRLSPTLVGVADVAGTLTYLLAVYAVGQALASPLEAVFGLLSRYMAIGGLAVALVAVIATCRRRRRSLLRAVVT